jgi:hypothetical protein
MLSWLQRSNKTYIINYFSVPLQIPPIRSVSAEWHKTGKITNSTVLFRFMAINMHYKEIITNKTIEFQLTDVSREHFDGLFVSFLGKKLRDSEK